MSHNKGYILFLILLLVGMTHSSALGLVERETKQILDYSAKANTKISVNQPLYFRYSIENIQILHALIENEMDEEEDESHSLDSFHNSDKISSLRKINFYIDVTWFLARIRLAHSSSFSSSSKGDSIPKYIRICIFRI